MKQKRVPLNIYIFSQKQVHIFNNQQSKNSTKFKAEANLKTLWLPILLCSKTGMLIFLMSFILVFLNVELIVLKKLQYQENTQFLTRFYLSPCYLSPSTSLQKWKPCTLYLLDLQILHNFQSHLSNKLFYKLVLHLFEVLGLLSYFLYITCSKQTQWH